jgi:WD40 repeat protein
VEGEGDDEEEIVAPVTDTDDDSRCQLALRLELKGADHIHCVAVSADASALACSSARGGTRVWALSPVGSKGDLSVQKLSVPVQAAGFCHSLAFSDDGRRLAAYSAKGLLLLMSIAEGTVEEEESDGEEDDDDDEEDVADTDDEERASGDDDSENDVEDDDDGDDDDEEEEDSEVDGSDEDQDSDDDDVKSSKKRKRSKKSSKKASGSSKKNKKASNASSKSKLRAQLHHAFDHKSQVLSTSGATSSSTGLGCSISKMCFSPDGMYLAAADADKTVYVYDIDRLRLHWRLPRFSSPITAIRFHPLSPSTLVVVLADNTFSIFEVGDLSLSLWSQKNTERIPAALKEVPGPIQGVSFDIGSGDVDIEAAQDTMILYGQGFIVYVNLSDEIPVNPKVVPATAVAASDGTAPKKERRGATKRGRRRRGGSKESNFAIIQRYRSLIHVNCLPDSQMVSK